MLSQQQQLNQQHHLQQQQQLIRPLSQNLGLSHSQGIMQGPLTMQQHQQQQQLQLQQQQQQQQQHQAQAQYNQRFNQPGQSFDQTAQVGMYANQQLQMQQQGHQQHTQQPGQQFGYQAGSQMNTGLNQPQQQMYQNQGVYQQQQQGQQQQVQNAQQMQANQSMGRGMRQQNPMINMPHQQQGQFSTMFQGPGTGIGNKQRPTSLDLNSNAPRFGQQMGATQGFGLNPMQAQHGPQLQLPNQQQQQQQQGQQQQSSGMLGSLFASGKKILEEATTPLGARGPLAHPNQPHQPMMGHHQAQQPQQQAPMQPNVSQMGGQPMGFGQQQQQQYNPMGPGGPGQANQPSGTILNTMKNIFKL